MAWAEVGLGHYDAAIEEANKAIDAGYKVFFPYLDLAAAHALKGEIDEAKTALTEARRLNPKLSVKWLMGSTPIRGHRDDRRAAQGGAAGGVNTPPLRRSS